jgi:hypothetical protein
MLDRPCRIINNFTSICELEVSYQLRPMRNRTNPVVNKNMPSQSRPIIWRRFDLPPTCNLEMDQRET